MELIWNLVSIWLAVVVGAALGMFSALILSTNRIDGGKVGSLAFGLFAFVYLLYPRDHFSLEPSEPVVLYIQKNFIREKKVSCSWQAYEDHAGKRQHGWCAKSKDGTLYPVILEDDSTD